MVCLRFCYLGFHLGHLGSHLGHLGFHLGHLPPLRAPNLEPRWSPDPPTGSQDSPQTPQIGDKMAPTPPNLEPRRLPDPHLEAKMAPRPSNLEPRWPSDPPTWSQDDALTPQLGAKMPPRCPKMSPRWSQGAPSCPRMLILIIWRGVQTVGHFGQDCHPVLPHSLSIHVLLTLLSFFTYIYIH